METNFFVFGHLNISSVNETSSSQWRRSSTFRFGANGESVVKTQRLGGRDANIPSPHRDFEDVAKQILAISPRKLAAFESYRAALWLGRPVIASLAVRADGRLSMKIQRRLCFGRSMQSGRRSFDAHGAKAIV